ncbi:hypothetical protein [Rhizobium leguminosarum]|uniref:hypothetical protein n=1 Tax=Rhizobium leguminosarum TaxID=384 RepID=UPI001441D567|nr:hypothetical protein [Rhizobium leguminosarum]NKL06630.1 hypothetical protein [Rhizobium leguminosarum bv. viciae]NKL87444.1 hypothetical protein [Rhizobium leguminosarum bv. viciae]NKL92957.1 hypothetical protein [Rhizobium leguminosarum bv. viciae]NKM96297.1 hypothetical protein [Rhizobium leguminosarum bv. viciae]
MRVITASVFLTLLQITAAHSAEDSRSSRLRAHDGEDASCYAVNRAYEDMHNSGRYSFTISELQEDGHLRLYMEGRAIDGIFYSRIENGIWESDWRLPIRTSLDANSGLPVFTSCKALEDSQTEEEPAFHYSARWHRYQWGAAIDIWISKTSGRFIKTISRYDKGAGEMPFPVAVQVMDYNRAHAIKPVVQDQ